MTQQERNVINAAIDVSEAAKKTLGEIPSDLLHAMFACVNNLKYNGCICRSNTPIRNPRCQAKEHRP